MRIVVRENHMEEIEDIRPEYPYTFHYVEMKNTRVPWHWHEEVEFDRVLTGHARLKLAGRTFEFSEGEGYFTNANVLSSLEGDQDTVIMSHLFHPVFLGGHYHSVFETKYLDPVLHNRSLEIVPLRGKTLPQREILTLLRKAEKLYEKPDSEFQTRSIFSEIWVHLLEEILLMEDEKPRVPSREQERLQIMILFIQENSARKLTLEEIAQSAAVSTREALRCFRTGIGQTPFDYLIQYRITQAQRLLRQTDTNIARIAMDTGFSTSAYFARIFKRETGMTPLQYRKAAAGSGPMVP